MNRLFTRLRIVGVVAVVLLIALTASSDEWQARHGLVSVTGVMNLTEPPPPSEVFFSGPEAPSQSGSWIEGLNTWRAERRQRLRYDGTQYERPDLEWTQHVFLQVQVLIWDRSLYDPDRGEYTVDRFLKETQERLGKVDAVLIWHVYPNLGVDDRNQFDLLQDLPGGLDGLHHLVEQFHNRGVKVFFPFLAWDTGTREKGTYLRPYHRNSKRSGRMELTSTHSKPFRRLFAKPLTLSMCPSLLNRSFSQEMSPSRGPISHGMTGSPGKASNILSFPW